MANRITTYSRDIQQRLPRSIPVNSLGELFYIKLIGEACYMAEAKTYKGTEIKLNRGQLLFSIREWQERFNLKSKTSIETWLRHLKDAGLITTEKAKGSYITVMTLTDYEAHRLDARQPKQTSSWGFTLEAARREVEKHGYNIDPVWWYNQNGGRQDLLNWRHILKMDAAKQPPKNNRRELRQL